MAIISCKECGHDVSTYAEKCPNCGCPVSIMIQNEPKYHSIVKAYDVVLKAYSVDNKMELVRFIRETLFSGTHNSLKSSLDLVNDLPQIIFTGVNKEIGEKVVSKLSELRCSAALIESKSSEASVSNEDLESTYLFTKDQPIKCPRCGSAIVTTTSRGYSLVWGFIGSDKTVNRCGKCGYTWKP